ncbi:MAG: diacylglycerol kinase family lipid kinase [Bacteroidales bacterium]|nr:diacylglycerol kinase family lipid kinase [Bacteroidales bacterium]
MEKRRILFIINPISGTRHSDNIERIARTTLDPTRFDMEFQMTRYKGHGAELARDAVTAGVDIVAAAGGDGTMNEVATQLVGTSTTFALIPHGSGNGMAYHLHIPLHLQKAIRIINDMHVEPVDTCMVNGQHFFSVAGIGFDAKVAFDFNQDAHRGFSNYFKHILKNYFHYRQVNYKIEYDGKTLLCPAFFITFANSSQWGYNVKIAPMASLQDGKLDICIVKKPKLFLKLLNVDLPKLLTSHFDRSNIVKYIQSEHIHIIPQTEEPTYLHIDGDAAGIVQEIDLQVFPQSLKVIVPRGI